ncbi:hypothetical protein O7626_31390 [Micromonospora sp. WMMD1102]|uniref:hypothetical protein n=1 Tax=Micromonospora sp. WMMD1102 TaxID=3016105 RepID=UPI00241507B3|nr:hypothetical protein [Micromonospora sp. WMMD1102]MDG4790373.1 hypothetical protein [Micromonospora sp. WMMD1102]
MTEPTADGDIVDCGQVALYVVNGSGGSINVTVLATAGQDGLDLEDLIVAVPAGDTRLIGPLPRRTFGQASDSADAGRAYVNYSAQTDVDRAVVSF